MVVSHLGEVGILFVTLGLGVLTPFRETAARRQRVERRRLTFDGKKPFGAFHRRDRSHQGLGVGVLGLVEQVSDIGALDIRATIPKSWVMKIMANPVSACMSFNNRKY